MMDDIRTGTRTLTAMFDSQVEAGRAVDRLRAAGVPDRCIRVTPGASERRDTVDYSDSTYREQNKGFWDSLSDFFFPDEDRHAYAEGLSRGAYMVAVHDYDASMEDTIVDVLDDEGTVDLDQRESEWRSSGYTGHRGSDYDTGTDISGTGGMAGGSSGLAGTAGGLGAAGAGMSAAAVGADMNTRGTIYDDGMQDRDVQMAADTGRRSQADLGSQQQGYADTGSMGQTGGMGTTAGMGAEGFGADRYNEDGTIKVVEEDIAVGKREVEQGAVRVRSYVREVPVDADVDLRATRVQVMRRPVDRAATTGDFDMDGQEISARETAEEAVVSKQARVVEEIGLQQETEVEHRHIQDTVRKTEVEIEDTRTGERTGLTGGTTGRSGSGSGDL